MSFFSLSSRVGCRGSSTLIMASVYEKEVPETRLSSDAHCIFHLLLDCKSAESAFFAVVAVIAQDVWHSLFSPPLTGPLYEGVELAGPLPPGQPPSSANETIILPLLHVAAFITL